MQRNPARKHHLEEMKSVWGWRPAAVGALVCVMVGVAAGGAAAGERAPAPGSPLVLAGQSDLAAGDYKKAIEVLEQAVAQDSRNARAYLLLGRAYGHRAETAFAVAAPALAIKARQNFEKAVALDPQSRDALDDLFEFYMQAPGILGGGLDKAAHIADLLVHVDEAQASFDYGRIAERRKEFGSAEAHLRRAVQLDPKQPVYAAELARFLAQRGS